jgi:hypothetical protein
MTISRPGSLGVSALPWKIRTNVARKAELCRPMSPISKWIEVCGLALAPLASALTVCCSGLMANQRWRPGP